MGKLVHFFKELSEMTKIKVGVLGATGVVGQKFVSLLQDHPYFELSEVAASPRSARSPAVVSRR